MTGFQAGEGNWVTSDGSTRQGTESEFASGLEAAHKVQGEGNSLSRGLCLQVLHPKQPYRPKIHTVYINAPASKRGRFLRYI